MTFEQPPVSRKTKGILLLTGAAGESLEPMREATPLPLKLAALVLLESNDTLLTKELAKVFRLDASLLCEAVVDNELIRLLVPRAEVGRLGELTRPLAEVVRLGELTRARADAAR